MWEEWDRGKSWKMDRAVGIWGIPSLQITGGSEGVIRALKSITWALIDTNHLHSTPSLHTDHHPPSLSGPPRNDDDDDDCVQEPPLCPSASTAVSSLIRHSAPVLEEGCYPWSSALPAQRDVIRTWAGKLQRLLSVRETGVAFTHRYERAHTHTHQEHSVKLLRATEKHT